MKIKPYIFVFLVIFLLGVFVFGPYFTSNESNSFIEERDEVNVNSEKLRGEDNFYLPPVLEDLDKRDNYSKFNIVAKESTHQFFPGIDTKTYSFGYEYLGPVIRVKDKENVTINVQNDLNEITTAHWHGLKVDGDNDGGPHQLIEPSGSWTANFVVNQSAGVSWFHPHRHRDTGRQVYMGLVGLLLIDDENSNSLDIPKDYGVNDFPLIIQDKRFDSNGQFDYLSNPMDAMLGMQGDTILVNGVIDSSLHVGRGIYRFRLVNGANARVFNFKLDKGNFYQIATEGGFLEKPLEMNNLVLSPGERAEILIDFSNYEVGEEISLNTPGFKIMTFVVDDREVKPFEILSELIPNNFLEYSTDLPIRNFELSQSGNLFMINNKVMDENRIDEYVKLGDLEVWKIRNAGMEMGGMMGGSGMGMSMDHSFHMHGVQFQIISRNGREPYDNEKGWKDTVRTPKGENVEVLVRFDYPGLFMYHCHFLEHEDRGMMGQFLVE